MNTLFAFGTYFTPSTIERGGRRGIMLWTSMLLTTFMFIFVVMINLGDKKSNATQWTAVASVVAYMFFFGYGWVGIPWLYGPEVSECEYPSNVQILYSRVIDCATSLQAFGRVIWCRWGMEHDIRHCFRRRDRSAKGRTNDLDLVPRIL